MNEDKFELDLHGHKFRLDPDGDILVTDGGGWFYVFKYELPELIEFLQKQLKQNKQ